MAGIYASQLNQRPVRGDGGLLADDLRFESYFFHNKSCSWL
jgi:hypothetical protein